MKNKVLGYAIGPIGSALLGLITLPLLTWFYPVEDIGRISMLQVVASFSVLLFCLGLDQAYTREYHETENKPKLFKQSVLPGAFFMLISFLVVYSLGLEKLSIWLYGIPSSYLTAISILCFALTFLSRFLSLILRMAEKAVAYSMSQLLPKLLFVFFIVGSVWFGFCKDIYHLVTAHALSIAAVFLIFLWNTKKTWLAAIPIRFDRAQNKCLLSFGLPLVMGGLASWGLNVMDKLFLRSMSTFEELGIYSVTFSIAAVATVFSGIFNTIWAPMVYKWVSEGIDTEKVDEVSGHVLAAIFFVIVLSGLFSWILPYLLPEKYAPIRYLITLCLIGPLLYTLSETTAVGIAISRKTVYSMLASTGAMLVNAVGNYLLVPEHGALGAAISTAIAFFVFYILRTEFSCLAWRKLPRFKSYLNILIVIIFSSFAGFNSELYTYFIPVWFCLLVYGLFVFRRSVNLSIEGLKKNVA